MITIPTTTQLYSNCISALETEYGTTIPVFGKVFLRVIAVVFAGILKLFYLAIGSLQKNIFVDTADRDVVIRFGKVKLGREPFPAVQGQYTITVTADATGSIPAGTVFKSDDDSLSPGKLYIMDAAHTVTVIGAQSITVRALEGGTDSQLNTGDTLTATAPILIADEAATVTAETVEPEAEEDIEAYRDKVILAFRLEPQGGAACDYRIWGLDAQGVAQIYPYVAIDPNEVDIYVEASSGDGTANSTILNEVEDCIELDPDTTLSLAERGRRPLGLFMANVFSVAAIDVDITFTGSGSISSANQQIIEDALTEMLATTRPFIAGADAIENRNDVTSINTIINAALTAVPGSIFTGVALEVNSVPVSTYTWDNGNIPKLNSVTFS